MMMVMMKMSDDGDEKEDGGDEDDDDGDDDEEDGDEGGEVQFNYNRNKTLWNTNQ